MRHSRPVISAFDFDVIKNALKAMIVESGIPESEWDKQARNLVRIFSGTGADETMIRVLLETCRTCTGNESEGEYPATRARGDPIERTRRNLQRSRELLARGRHHLWKREAERAGPDGLRCDRLSD
ncbi:hypothetical protein [Mesorhizobium sp. WSM3626]|uniref:hypothetical protein n=1 Tax=Mesorhizobium sp. WSM3626 TaxID=1040987 RepID=UPI0012EBD7D3|nr:hypothetical protein [Mesorhizobium sp. WSM3626]